MAQEAFVAITERIITAPSLGTPGSTIMTAGVVISDIGPVVPTVVSSQQELLDNYTLTGQLSPTDHTSLHNAYRLLATGSMMITRSTNSGIVSAVNSLGDELFFNNVTGQSYNVVKPVYINYTQATLDAADYHIRIGSYVYYNNTDPAITGTISVLFDGDLNKLHEKLVGTEDFSINVIVDQDNAGDEWLGWLLYCSDDSINISDSGDTTSFNIGEMVDVWYDVDDATVDYDITTGNIRWYTGVAPAPSTTIDIEVADWAAPTEITNYNANNLYDAEFVTIVQSKQTTVGGDPFYRHRLAIYSTVAVAPDGVTTDKVYSDNVTNLLEPAQQAFYVIPFYGALTDHIDLEIIDNSGTLPNTWILRWTVGTDITDFVFSLTVGALNEFGQNIYIDYINNLTGLPFYIVVGDTSQVPTENDNISIGASIGYSATNSATAPYLAQALNRFIDQEVDLIDFFCDLNITNVAFQNNMLTVATNNQSQAIISFPNTLTNKALVINYRTSTGIDNDRAYFIAGNDKDTATLGFLIDLAAGVLYIERCALNKSGNIEFAPVIHKTNGRVNSSNPVVLYNKSDREDLLDYQINTIISKDGLFYINDILTGKKFKDPFQEEANRRLANKVNRDVAVIMEQFIGQNNDNRTRGLVVNTIQLYLDTYILNQSFRPDATQIICDTSNNSDADIAANKLNVTIKIRYKNAIKYITILNEAYEIGTEF